MRKSIIFLTLFISLIFTIISTPIVKGDIISQTRRNILILNSYNKGYIWSDKLMAAIEKGIKESGINANIHVDYMNSKQINDSQYYEKLYELYKYKYREMNYDVIISTEDDAYQFLLQYSDEIFPGVPVIFCGVNDFETSQLDELDNFTGIIEDTGFDDTVDIVRRLMPNIKNIHVVVDKTTIGNLNVESLMEEKVRYSDINFTLKQSDQISDLLEGLPQLGDDTALIMAPCSAKDEGGKFVNIQETSDLIVDYTKVPVFSLSDISMGSGVLGSRVNSSTYQGNAAASMVVAVLSGQAPEQLSLVYDRSKQFVFDYYEMKKFGISEEALPPGSQIINRPGNLYSFTANTVWAYFVITIGLLIFINLMMLINIKRRKHAEKALLHNEGVLRATLNATAEGILVTDMNGGIIDYNPLFVRMWDVPEENKELKSLNQMLEYALGMMQNPERHYHWVEKSLTSPQPAYDTVYLKNGKVFEVYSESLDIQGKMQGRVWSFKDITLRKRVEIELQKSEERYRRLVELSPDAIFMAIDGRNVFANAAGLELLAARSEDQIYGKPTMDFMIKNLEKNHQALNFEVSDNQALYPLAEMKIKRLDNTFVDVEAATTVFDYNGKEAVLSVVRDITARKETEVLKKHVEETTRKLNEAWEYDKLKTEFFSNISHELRTPINVILGAQKLFGHFLEGVELGDRKDKLNRYISMMRQNCYRLMRLVNNLIDITRIDAGFFNINLKNYDIVNIVENITLSVAEYVQEKEIELIFDTEIEEKTIACDPDKIERIMLNLLSNAIKFTNKGGSINVYLKEEDKFVVISVSDTGIGIPEEKLKNVFDRFMQVDKSFIRNHEGSGIGLSIVKSLVELHGGHIELRSKPNEGTTFDIYLPDNLVAEEEEAVKKDGAYQNSIERINVEFSDIYFD